MTLYINTASHDEIIIILSSGAKLIAQKKINAPRQQAEKLLPAIDRLLKSKKIKLSALKKMVVANRGGSFTSLRIGVITANALGYALKIPVVAENVVEENQVREREEKSNKKPGDKLTKNPEKNSPRVKKFSYYSIVVPLYDREPTIGISKKNVL